MMRFHRISPCPNAGARSRRSSLSILVILKLLETWAQKGYELYAPIAQRFHGGKR
jgi:hypothetical protein